MFCKTNLFNCQVGKCLHDSVSVIREDELRVAPRLCLELGFGNELAEMDPLTQRLQHRNVRRRRGAVLLQESKRFITKVSRAILSCQAPTQLLLPRLRTAVSSLACVVKPGRILSWYTLMIWLLMLIRFGFNTRG